MLEAFWIPLIPPFFIGLLLSWAMESLLQPRPQAPWNRPLAANLTHIGVWTLAFALELALFRRPYFAVANVLAIQLLLVLVSRAKYQALQEPFVYPDFEYFTDAIKHPRLYLPFFGWKNALASGGGYGLALWAGLTFEDSVTAGAGIWLVSFADLPQESVFDATAPVVPFFMHSLALMLAGFGLAALAARRLDVSCDANSDLTENGLISALCAYARAEKQPVDSQALDSPYQVKFHGPAVNQLPNLISVQSESFFDVRREFPCVRDDVLRGYDTLCAEAIAFGELEVAARGANTVRTEFAFLSGLDSSELGIHKYNPYRRLGVAGVPTLASYLRALGYHTICVHPYHGSFYRRDEVLPAMGFDEFVDLSSFESADRAGAYVADEAVAEWIEQRLAQGSDKPIYIHAITMENHGPLHLEDVTEEDVHRVLKRSMPAGCGELVAYARHLVNADKMFSMLRDTLLKTDRPSGLCIYGDHVPIMPEVYRNMGSASGLSNYLIWNNGRTQDGAGERMNVKDLGLMLLKEFGLKA